MENQKRKYLGIVINAAFVLFMIKLDAFVVYVSLPTIARDFSINISGVSFIAIAYLMMLTSTMLIFGKIEDGIGIKKLQAAGYILFTIASLLCGLVPNIGLLVTWRAIQGIGAAMMLTSAFASVNKYVPLDKKGWSLGVITTAAALGIGAGAPIGGIITDLFSWRWIFLINVPLGILGTLFALKVVPSDTERNNFKLNKFDFVGAALSFIGICGLSYILSIGSAISKDRFFSVIYLVGSILVLIAFILWEIKFPNPLLDFSIFRNRGFVFANAAFFTVFMAMSGIDFITPFYLELAERFQPYQVGLFMLFYSAIYSLCSPYAGRLADEKRFSFMGSASMLLAAIACTLFAFTIHIPGVWCAIIFIAVWAVANAVFIPLNNRMIFINIPNNMQGAGSAVYNTFNNLSTIFGVCAFQLIFSNMTHSADIPDPQSMSGSGWSMELMFIVFRNIFILAGIIYIITLVLNILAQRSTRNK